MATGNPELCVPNTTVQNTFHKNPYILEVYKIQLNIKLNLQRGLYMLIYLLKSFATTTINITILETNMFTDNKKEFPIRLLPHIKHLKKCFLTLDQ